MAGPDQVGGTPPPRAVATHSFWTGNCIVRLTMTPKRILGIVLLVVGVGLLVVGMNASHSVADQVKDTFTGRFTEGTTWYILGGIALGIVGLLLTAFGGRSGKE